MALEIVADGNPFGSHRVITPVGVLPQPAEKIDNNMTRIWDNELDEFSLVEQMEPALPPHRPAPEPARPPHRPMLPGMMDAWQIPDLRDWDAMFPDDLDQDPSYDVTELPEPEAGT